MKTDIKRYRHSLKNNFNQPPLEKSVMGGVPSASSPVTGGNGIPAISQGKEFLEIPMKG